MRIALLTEGGYPFARGESVAWCDRLLRGLEGHEFEVYALSRSARQEKAQWCELPANVRRVRTAPLWGLPARASVSAGGPYGRRERRRFAECFGQLARAVCGTGSTGEAASRGSEDQRDGGAGELADRFASGLYGLADLARERGGLPAALRSQLALRTLESACRTPGTLRAAHSARVADLLAVASRLERALRPLSLDWYGERGGDGGGLPPDGSSRADAADGACGLASADLCHAVGGGPAALPGLLAKRLFGTPLLLTEYGVRLREHYLTSAADAVAPAAAGAPVRALLASFQRLLAQEAYAQAELITPGDAHARRWQEHCGARRERLRTVHPGMDASPFAEVGEAGESAASGARARTLVWVGRIEPDKDLAGLLQAFSGVRTKVPEARLRIVASEPGQGPGADGYLEHCRAVASRIFSGSGGSDGGGAGGGRSGEAGEGIAAATSPVTFEELGGPGIATLADAYAAGCVAVISSAAESFPVPLAEAMFCASATVSTDVGAVREVIGGTGLVVPPRDPRALADSCVALLADPARRVRLGAAARARALELFTVEQNIAAFRAIYLELMSRGSGDGGIPPVRDGDLPFARPPESHVPGRWAAAPRGLAAVAAGGRRAGGGAAGRPPGAGTPPARPGVPRSPRWSWPGPPEGTPAGVADRGRAGARDEGEAR